MSEGAGIVRCMEEALDCPVRIALTSSNKWLDVPREPTAVMLNAETHIAVSTWSHHWVEAPSHKKVGWAICVDVMGHESQSLVGYTTAAEPLPAIREAILSVVEEALGTVWVVVGKKRSGLALSLMREGLAVTSGFRAQNRAESKLEVVASAERQALQLEALAKGYQSRRVVSTKKLPKTIKGDLHWWPSTRQISSASVTELMIAADASHEQDDGSFARCIVSDQGDLVIESGLTPKHIGDLELDAVSMALQMITERQPHRVLILSDSLAALTFIWETVDGTQARRIHSKIVERSQQQFREAWRVASLCSDIEFAHVPGHTGEGLHAAADEIVRVARRAAYVPRDQIEDHLAARTQEILDSVVKLEVAIS